MQPGSPWGADDDARSARPDSKDIARPDSADVARPDGWHPWQISFTGDAFPGEVEENSCTTEGIPSHSLSCMGSGFRGELPARVRLSACGEGR